MNHKKWSLIGIIITALLAIAGCIVLPEDCAEQFSFDGTVTHTLPRYLAVMLPALISLIGAWMGTYEETETVKKGFVLLILGIVLQAANLIVNGFLL